MNGKHIIEGLLLTLVLWGCLYALDASAELTPEIGGAYHLTASGDDYSGYRNNKQAYVGLLYNDSYFTRLGYERGRDNFLGQPLGRIDAITVAAGFRVEVAPRLSLEASAGVWVPIWVKQNGLIIDEVTFTHLVNNHANEGRPIPLKQARPGHPYPYVGCKSEAIDNCYDATVDYHESLYATLGLSYALTDSLSANVSYRYLPARQYMAIGINDGRIHMLDDQANAPGGWWMEDGTRDFSTIQLDLRWSL